MKNQYFGDINDYLKYRLIRILNNRGLIRLGFCWMLTPDDSKTDGKFIDYLSEPKKFKGYDPELFEFLLNCVNSNKRNVMEIQNSTMFPNSLFFDQLLKDDRAERKRYFNEMFKLFNDVDLIFFDPDNGLEIDSKALGHKHSSKFLFWEEVIRCYKADKSILIYQHFNRKKRDLFISSTLSKIHSQTDLLPKDEQFKSREY